jgi:hypothetical protein
MDASLDEWSRYMIDSDEVTNIRFTNEIKVLGDKERQDLLNKTDGPLVEATRRDVHKMIESIKATLQEALNECQFPGCAQISEPVFKMIKLFESALIKGSWTGMSGFKSERKITLSDLLSMKAAGRRKTEEAVASLAEIVHEEQKRHSPQLSSPEINYSSSGSSNSGLIIAIVIIGLVLVFVIAGWFLYASKTQSEYLLNTLDNSFKRQLQTQIQNV